MNICFVCSGNICRSPLAEGLFRHYIKLANRADNFTIHSAGTLECYIKEVSVESVIVAKEYGADISSHRSRHLSSNIAAQADVILVMTKAHLNWINENLPQYKSKSWLLTDYAIENPNDIPHKDIEDPYGMDIDKYREIGKSINAEIKRIIEKL